LVLKQPLGKAVKCPLFPLNLRLLFQKLKFWNSLSSKIGSGKTGLKSGAVFPVKFKVTLSNLQF
jgi:hypothetical protein